VPSKDTDKTVHSSGSICVESSERDPVVETAHVKRCVVDDLVNVSAACPVKGIMNTTDNAGSSCLSVEQQPQIIGSDDKGGDVVEPDNGPSLGSVETIDRVGETGGVHISALTHFEISIDGKPEPVMTLADSGSQIPVIRRETISQLKAPTHGQVKIQGIFGNPVTADLVILQVRRNHKSGIDLGSTESYHTPSISVMFAVTELMAPGCDDIIPTDVATELHVGSLGKRGTTPG